MISLSTRQLSDEQGRILEEKKINEPNRFRDGFNKGVDDYWSILWPVGATLRVRFIDGEKSLREKVAASANEWTKYANVKFVFDVPDEDAELRISFEHGQGSWSYSGTKILRFPLLSRTLISDGLHRHHQMVKLGELFCVSSEMFLDLSMNTRTPMDSLSLI